MALVSDLIITIEDFIEPMMANLTREVAGSYSESSDSSDEKLSGDEVVEDNVEVGDLKKKCDRRKGILYYSGYRTISTPPHGQIVIEGLREAEVVHPTHILVTFIVIKFMVRFVMIIHFQAPTTIRVALLGRDICGRALCTYLK